MVESAVAAGAAARLELARGLLRRVEGRAASVRPAADLPEADGRMLPVPEALAGLLPMGGLRRGSTVVVPSGVGSTSLLLALLAEASAHGAWVGVVGRPELGLAAAAEAGIRLERLALVPHPGPELPAVTTALLDGLDLVALAGVERAGLRAADRQRLAARARQRGAVLLPLGAWPGADVELSCTDVRWQGLGTGADGGSGRLCARRLRVRARGRGLGPAGRSAGVLLPAPGGGVAACAAGGVARAGAGAEGSARGAAPGAARAGTARPGAAPGAEPGDAVREAG